jgi:hypothetical protein
MALPNTLFAKIVCPSCNEAVEVEIDLSFGDTRKKYQYTVGDLYDWRPRASFQNGGRPKDGNLDGVGLARCANCGDIYAVKVIIRKDRILDILFDADQNPFVTPWPGYAPQPAQAVEISISEPESPPHAKIEVDLERFADAAREALIQLGKLGVSVYLPSAIASPEDIRILIPHDLRPTAYIRIAYLMAQIANDSYQEPPVEFVDSFPHGLKYRIRASNENNH